MQFKPHTSKCVSGNLDEYNKNVNQLYKSGTCTSGASWGNIENNIIGTIVKKEKCQ